MVEPMVVVVAGVAAREGCVMLCRRDARSLEGMKWEFPGGKVEKGESPEAALVRELREELDIRARVDGLLDAVVHPCSPYPDRGILLLYYAVTILEGEPWPVDCGGVAWTPPEGLTSYDLAPADALFVRRNFSGSGQSDI